MIKNMFAGLIVVVVVLGLVEGVFGQCPGGNCPISGSVPPVVPSNLMTSSPVASDFHFKGLAGGMEPPSNWGEISKATGGDGLKFQHDESKDEAGKGPQPYDDHRLTKEDQGVEQIPTTSDFLFNNNNKEFAKNNLESMNKKQFQDYAKEVTGKEFSGDPSKYTLDADGILKSKTTGKSLNVKSESTIKEVTLKGDWANFKTSQSGTEGVNIRGLDFSAGAPAPATGPGACGPGGCGGSPGGSSGGAGGGGGASGNDLMKEAFAAMGQVMGFLGELKGAFSEKGDSTAQVGPDGNFLATTNDQMIIENPETGEEVLIQPDEENEEAKVQIVNSDLDGYFTNAESFWAKAGIGDTVNVKSAETTFVEHDPGTSAGFDALASVDSGGDFDVVPDLGIDGSSAITAAAITEFDNQYVVLKEYDLGIEGKNIVVDTFKSLRAVVSKGAKLRINNGNSKIIFDDKYTLYERRIKENPNSMHMIQNRLDKNNYFRLKKYVGDEENYLVDGKKVVSVGNKIVEHPNIKGLMIAEIRKDMYK